MRIANVSVCNLSDESQAAIKSLGLVILAIRRKHKISQEQLAERFGVSRGSIALWETGHTIPCLATFFAIKDHFGIDLTPQIPEGLLAYATAPAA